MPSRLFFVYLVVALYDFEKVCLTLILTLITVASVNTT